MSNTQTLDKTYIANTYARFPVELVSGKGSLIRARTARITSTWAPASP